MNKQRIIIVDEYGPGRAQLVAAIEALGMVVCEPSGHGLTIKLTDGMEHLAECRIVDPVEKPYWQRNSGKGKRKKW
jgi:hypothetical protein